jgi:predicted membrane protein
MCGQEGFFGTGAFQVILDIEEAQKLDAVSEYKPVNIDDEIDNFFGNIENPDDPCGINKIAIQNNVGTIEAEDMGNDNTYNPGF